MLLINGTNLNKSFAGEPLFSNVSFNVYDNDKIGFVGVNGAGKSTLFKIINGIMSYDSGDIIKNKDLKIGYLEQHPVANEDATIMDEIMTVFSEVIDIETTLAEVNADIEYQRGDIDSLIRRQADLQERFIALDGAFYKSKIKSVLTGLGFSEDDFYTPMGKLSGGQKTRVELCKILLSDTNLLLLDEPTNHLDIESVEWLEDFLMSYPGAFIVISHDRFFLDRVTEKTFELENKKLRSFDGSYSEYVAQREIEKVTEQRNYDYTTREIHRLEQVIEQQRVWKKKKNKKTHTLDNTRKVIERLQRNLVVPEKGPASMRFKFKACPGGANNVLVTENLGMSFEGNKLFENVNTHIKKGEKVFLLGPNGCGKTTLIRILMEQYQQTAGKYKIGDNIQVGYYDQLNENVDREKTVINEICDTYPALTQTEARSALALFLFCGEDVFKDVKSLSGGELARLVLTKLLLDQVNLLIMDEPTNHLDIISREALEKALIDYDGTMLMVSHDRYFINKIADRILYLTPNGIVEYEGNYDDYLNGRQEVAEEVSVERVVSEGALDYKEKKRLESQRRKILNRFAKVEELIEANDKKIDEFTKECEDPKYATDYVKLTEFTNAIEALRAEQDALMEEWEELQMTIEDLPQ